jgi:recombination protein RecR
LPGIGRRSALRLALHIVKQPAAYAHALSGALLDVVQKMRFCSQCFHLTSSTPCSICQDDARDASVICVVEESSDLMAIERTHSFRGVYHVLQGSLSPLDGIGPESLRIQELVGRIQAQSVQELILALNPNVTGEATSLYLSRLIKPLNIKVTKLAAGIPVGSDIEYVDQMTLSRAIEARMPA